jgi:DNA topoisomerase-2
MSVIEPPKITNYSGTVGKTIVEVYPDFERFGMTGYTEEWLHFFRKEAIDTAMILGQPLKFNNKKISIPDMTHYIKKYIKGTSMTKTLHTQNNECDVYIAEYSDMGEVGDINHISFVNGIYTQRGGVHVDAIRGKILGQIRDAMNTTIKKPKTSDKPLPKFSLKTIQHYFIIWIVCKLNQPQWNSQSKEFLTEPKPHIKDLELTTDQLDQVLKWKFMTLAKKSIEVSVDYNRSEASKKEERLEKSDKFRDANNATNKRKRENTQLYITEGDSAATLINAGVASLNLHDDIGVLPIKGKITCATKKKQHRNNELIKWIVNVLGLTYGMDYTDDKNHKTLRYQKAVVFATDADVDGYHIIGLLLSLFYTEWPSLFEIGYVRMHMFPPRSVIFNGKKSWLYDHTTQPTQGIIKYYKGLGTYRNTDAEIFFTDPKIITFTLSQDDAHWMDVGMGENVIGRREWIINHLATMKEETKKKEEDWVSQPTVANFIQTMLIQYHIDTLERMLIGFVDGCKEGGRKTIYTLYKKRIFTTDNRQSGTVKIKQLSGRVAEYTNYHHNEDMLANSMIKQGQGYVGSNNIPLIYADGQFGTRFQMGDDNASPRYIFGALDPFCKSIFKEIDWALCPYRVDEGKTIEPVYLLPIVPLSIINGGNGLASAFSGYIPPHNPIDCVDYIHAFLNEDTHALSKHVLPWWRNFRGEVEVTDGYIYTSGIYENKEGDCHVTELPIGTSFQEFKLYLTKHEYKFTEHHMVDRPYFIIKNVDKTYIPEGVMHKKLGKLGMHHMWCVDEQGLPYKPASIQDMLKRWCEFRLKKYEERKTLLVQQAEYNLKVMENKVRWITAICDDALQPKKYKSKELIEQLVQQNYGGNVEDDSLFGKNLLVDTNANYTYLTKMSMDSLTLDHVEKLNQDTHQLKQELEEVKKISAKDLWRTDLSEFLEQYKIFLQYRNENDDPKKTLKPKSRKSKTKP